MGRAGNTLCAAPGAGNAGRFAYKLVHFANVGKMVLAHFFAVSPALAVFIYF